MGDARIEQRESGRIRSGLLKVRLNAPMPQEATEILDISLRGMGLRVPFALATGQELAAEVYHPILESAFNLDMRVAWCRIEPGETSPKVGLEFSATSEGDRMALRQIQAAEVSCRVLDGDRMAGFVLNQAESRWALYDENTFKVALLTKKGPQFQVSFLGVRPSESVSKLDADTLPEALQMALNLENSPFVVPPEGGHWIPARARTVAATPTRTPARPALPRAPKVPARDSAKSSQQMSKDFDDPAEVVAKPEPRAKPKGRATGRIIKKRVVAAEVPEQTEEAATDAPQSPGAFHSVMAAGFHVGYLACTSVDDVWSLYDTDWNEVAIISPEGNTFRLVYLGTAPDDSLEYLMAKTFLGGIQIGFDLKVEPELNPPIHSTHDPSESNRDLPEDTEEDLQPDESYEEMPLPVDRDHHCIMDSELGLVGYVAKVTRPHGWYGVYATSREKVATVGKDGERFKIMFIGQVPGDSLEYMVAKTFRGALALTFDLDALPKLDPPLPK